MDLIDSGALAHLIALEAGRDPYRGLVLPEVLYQPTVVVNQLDADTSEVGAAVLVELRRGYTTHLIVRRHVPAGTEVSAHWRQREGRTQELAVRDGQGALIGLAIAAPLPELDDEEL